MKRQWLLAAVSAVCTLATADGWAHYGRLENNGCHYDQHGKGYHCHTGKNAGRQFKSRAEATSRPKATEPVKKKKITTTTR